MGLGTDLAKTGLEYALGVGEFADKKRKKKGGDRDDKVDVKADQKVTPMHSGGKVRKTKNYRLKKGERVLTRGQQRKAGMIGKSRGKSKSR